MEKIQDFNLGDKIADSLRLEWDLLWRAVIEVYNPFSHTCTITFQVRILNYMQHFLWQLFCLIWEGFLAFFPYTFSSFLFPHHPFSSFLSPLFFFQIFCLFPRGAALLNGACPFPGLQDNLVSCRLVLRHGKSQYQAAGFPPLGNPWKQCTIHCTPLPHYVHGR